VKYQSAQTYINYCAKVLGDTCPTDEKVLILPYESRNQFYIEYVNYYKTFYGSVAHNMAGESTFSKALDDMHDTVRLAHAKGTELCTETCDELTVLALYLVHRILSMHPRLSTHKCIYSPYNVTSCCN